MTPTTLRPRTSSTNTHRSSHKSSRSVRRLPGTLRSCPTRDLRRAGRRLRNTRLVIYREIYTTLRVACRRQLSATKASHHCTVIDKAGDNTKKLFGITNALIGRSAPVQLPDSHDDSTLAETFNQFFTRKIVNIHLTIDTRGDPNTFVRRLPDVHENTQLCEFVLATTADIRRIVIQSTAKSYDPDPLPTNLLKNNLDILAPILSDIVNVSLQSGVVPADMKHALLTPILKKIRSQHQITR